MISIIGGYLARLFLFRFLVLLTGLAAVGVILDFLADGDQVLKRVDDGVLYAMLRYSLLRLPQIVSELMPFTVLVAALLTLIKLVRQSELTALQAAGVSQFQMIAALVPVAFLLAAALFLVDDRAMPASVTALRAWGIGDYRANPLNDPNATTWVRQGQNVVRVRLVDWRTGALQGVTIFRRDANGNVEERIDAASAELGENGWTLYDVQRSSPDGVTRQSMDTLSWPGVVDPGLLASLSAHPREMTLYNLWRVASSDGYGNRPSYLYDAWLQRRIARPITIVMMLLMTVPLVQRYQRRTSGALMLAAGIALGFLYWCFDGLTFAFGEAGLMPAVVAVWTPLLALVAVACTIGFHQELNRAPRSG